MSFQVKDSNLSMYTDDHQVYITGKNTKEVEKRLKAGAKAATSWYSDNFLLANPDKFRAITFNQRRHGRTGNKSHITISID